MVGSKFAPTILRIAATATLMFKCGVKSRSVLVKPEFNRWIVAPDFIDLSQVVFFVFFVAQSPLSPALSGLGFC